MAILEFIGFLLFLVGKCKMLRATFMDNNFYAVLGWFSSICFLILYYFKGMI